MITWRQFTCDPGGDMTATYLRPIFDAAQPYAVVMPTFIGPNSYRVTSADSIEHASVIADSVMRERDGDCGLRVYLRANGWVCQVHYVGADSWPTHQECIDRVDWSNIERTKAGPVIVHGNDYGVAARERQLRAAKALEQAQSQPQSPKQKNDLMAHYMAMLGKRP